MNGTRIASPGLRVRVVATQSLDDAGPRLRHDAYGPRQRDEDEQDEHDDDGERDCSTRGHADHDSDE